MIIVVFYFGLIIGYTLETNVFFPGFIKILEVKEQKKNKKKAKFQKFAIARTCDSSSLLVEASYDSKRKRAPYLKVIVIVTLFFGTFNV